MKDNYIGIYFIIVFVLLLIVFLIGQNNDLVTSRLEYKNIRIPKAFDNFSIIQISDLHNKRFGVKQYKLINKIKLDKPDIILITGDIIDRRRYNLNTAIEFVKEAAKLAPIYYAPGNHEVWSFKYPEIKIALIAHGVIVLDDEKVEIVKDGSKIEIIGLKDAAFYNVEHSKSIDFTEFKNALNKFSNPKNFSILLSHRPEIFDFYVQSKIDLVFSGHAHGGQFRLPIIGPLFSPNQGIFPTYTSGLHQKDDTSMVVSRGLGNSLMPIRLFNKPEIVKVTLKRGETNEK